jgi:formylglycine-generating enzyme required for sulfatase activity
VYAWAEGLLRSLVMGALLAPTAAAEPAGCPADMRLVSGTHHENVQRLCLDVRQGKCWSFVPGLALLEAQHTPVHTCMDTYEWPNEQGKRPEVMMRFVDAEQMCAGRGKRLCTEFEWELACEGPEHLPWSWGWQQRSDVCNNDKRYRPYNPDKLESADRNERDREVARLWQGAASGSYPGCRTHFGVMDMLGNVEEWVATSRKEWPYRSSLKGGFWSKKWAGCRGTNEGHSEQFRFYEIGFRCCRDPSVPGE